MHAVLHDPGFETWDPRTLWPACLCLSPVAALTTFPNTIPNYREYAYVTNGGSGTVSVYDVVNVRVDRELPVGQNPTAVTASPTRNEVYVVNSGARGTPGLRLGHQRREQLRRSHHPRPPASRLPSQLDPTGDLAYVGQLRLQQHLGHRPENSAARSPTSASASSPSPRASAPDGKTVVVANRGGNSVSVIDPATRKVRAVFEGCPGASDVVILPDSSKAFAACSGGHQVMAILLAHEADRPDVRNVDADQLESLLDVGRAPVHLALKPDGGEVFVSNSLSNSISEVVHQHRRRRRRVPHGRQSSARPGLQPTIPCSTSATSTRRM